MAIKQNYFKYLEHFGTTAPVCRLHQQPHASNLVTLRHDIDYDLDLALEMAYWEKMKGCRATYYLLHTADYWQDPRLVEKCLQLQDFGHEIGLHLNVLTEWMSGDINEIKNHLLNLLSPLRAGGVAITGVSAHGDKSCYVNQFINYWCFSELRPANPLQTENGLSAEGIAVDDSEFRIAYPPSEKLTGPDGRQLDLWSVSMKELGIDYDAVHLAYDAYFTDSGGEWKRSSDPISVNLSNGRYQILMHPIHWKGTQKVYFFLSTARSGSKWLVNMLDKATSLTARHELTLNHTYQDGQLVMNKRTSHGLAGLIKNRNEAKELINQARDFAESCKGDYAEANVYLEQFIPELLEIFPDACLIHLYRDPVNVVRSVMNRNWYDTPEDTAHPEFDVKNFKCLPQFSKACWYVRKTNETLLSLCSHRLQFEEMVSRPDYLPSKLRDWGIPYFPRLAEDSFGKIIDANKTNAFPPCEKWTLAQKKEFASILSPVNAALHYENAAFKPSDPSLHNLLFEARQQVVKLNRKIVCPPERINFDLDMKPSKVASKGCKLKRTSSGLHILPKCHGHAHALLGGGSWYKIKSRSGWQTKRGYYFRGSMSVEAMAGQGRGSLICLMYNQKGELFHKRVVGVIADYQRALEFSFSLVPETRRFNLAIYIPAGTLESGITIKDVQLQAVLLQ